MKSANIGTLRNNLSRYLDLVRKGETIEIFDRNTPIARLGPIDPETRASKGKISPWLAQLAREGRVRLGTGRIDPDSLERLPGSGSARVVEALLEERRSGR